MYKTIRHGENSLQYTILPQNDDFRIEGKLSGAGRSASTSASASASASASGKAKGQRRRRSFFAYLGLIFVCTVIIGAVLIPFLVSAECLPNPAEWFLKTKAALIHSPPAGGGEAAGPSTLPTGSPLLQQNVGRNVQIVNRNGIEQFVIRVNKTTNPSAGGTTSGIASGSPTVATSSGSSTSISSSTSTTTTTTTTAPAPTTTSSSTSTTTTRAPPVTTPRYLPPPPPPPATTITTRIIQVPLLKSAAKKPIMPPVLAKAQGPQILPGGGQNSRLQPASESKSESELGSGSGSGDGQKSNAAWIKTHWAYIDPSTYFQWSGYKDEDSVLLPALLGFALIGVILIITVCLVARNKRTIVSSVRKRNRNDIEEQGAEDNATLLTTTNMSDDD
ncbi:A-agglutinin anchorage subunit [Drosophila santomea]|uniref:A-agglutinin anchorage subunit n=1 Tax=Drosophila santomea TaxID=129105 RepID=UPI001954255A|nr:A-agglutinin anchorage subunit [Drosophila santomea]